MALAGVAYNGILDAEILLGETVVIYGAGVVGQILVQLAKKSGVGLRSIQLYEQRQKDINKASAESLYKISRVLGCAMEDLLER